MEHRFRPGDMIRLREKYVDNEERAGLAGLLRMDQVVRCMGTRFNEYNDEMVIYYNEGAHQIVNGWLAQRFELVEEDFDPESLLDLL